MQFAHGGCSHRRNMAAFEDILLHAHKICLFVKVIFSKEILIQYTYYSGRFTIEIVINAVNIQTALIGQEQAIKKAFDLGGDI